MATSLSTLVSRTRRFMRDYPFEDALTASCTSTATSITVADTSLYSVRWHLQIDTEVLYTTSITNSTTLAVRRGQKGSTNASHASSASVLVRPEFFYDEIVEALNAGVEACFPLIYRKVVDESLTGSASVYEYTVPAMPGHSGYILPYIAEIQLKDSSETAYRTTRAWEIVRGTTPKIKFRRALDGGETIRLIGYGPLPPLTAGSSLDDQFPPHGVTALIEYAAAYLLASGETGRVRVDTGVIDNREQANVTGSSLRASDALMRRFYNSCSQAAMPPPGKHVKVTI